MRVRAVCFVLIVGVALVGGLAGLCEMVCAAAGIEHAGMQHHASSQSAASTVSDQHAGHHMAPMGDAPHDAPDADGTRPHCPMCSGEGGCVMSDAKIPVDASLSAGQLPRSAPTFFEAAVIAAPPAPSFFAPSHFTPPESEPPRV